MVFQTPTGPRQQPLTAGLQRELRRIVDCLLDPDDSDHDRLLAHITTPAMDPARPYIIDRLLRVLRRPDLENRRRAGEALIAIGPPAVADVFTALLRSGDVDVQVVLADIVACIAPRIPQRESLAWFLRFDAAVGVIPNQRVAMALIQAQSAFCAAHRAHSSGSRRVYRQR
jgi:hypothetical protein